MKVLNEDGYARYDGSTARYLKDTAEWARTPWNGDLRKLRDASDGPDEILQKLRDAKGLGKTGAAIFAREVQLVWDPLYPRADGPALDAASDLGLPEDVKGLAALAGSRERFVRLIAPLTRARLEGPHHPVKEVAA